MPITEYMKKRRPNKSPRDAIAGNASMRV